MQITRYKHWLAQEFNGLTPLEVCADAGITPETPLTDRPTTATLDDTDLIYVMTDVEGTPTVKAIAFSDFVAEVAAHGNFVTQE
jgi:hypothetical protein